MAATVVLLLSLPMVLSYPVWNTRESMLSVDHWPGLGGYGSSYLPKGQGNALSWQQEAENGDGDIYQDEGDDSSYGGYNPRFGEGVSHGTRFGGDSGSPRYGGRSRISRYGIDYGNFHTRRYGEQYPLPSFSTNYGSWPGAFAYGFRGYPVAYDQTYPRWTGRFVGREHPSSFDPYLAEL